ncbi:MAG: phosphatase PAP2 family protein [Betaproteobacteria bacterium]
MAVLHVLASTVIALDARLACAVRDIGHQNTLGFLMLALTDLGNGFVLLGTTLALYATGNESTKRYARLAVTAFVVLGLVVQSAKHLVGRERPLGGSFDSFPSGHTSEAFCMSWIWGDRWRKLRTALFFLAALVGFSRVYLMAHYPLDVIAGAALGSAGGAMALAMARRTPPKLLEQADRRLVRTCQGKTQGKTVKE